MKEYVPIYILNWKLAHRFLLPQKTCTPLLVLQVFVSKLQEAPMNCIGKLAGKLPLHFNLAQKLKRI